MTVSCRSRSTGSSGPVLLRLVNFMMHATYRVALVFSAVATLGTSVPVVAAQTQAVAKPQVAKSRTSDAAVPGTPPAPAGATLPTGYLIGPDDVLSIVFWRDKDMSADVVV